MDAEEVVKQQQKAIDTAITLLEELVLNDEASPDKVEEIIKVLTYVG